MNSYLLALTGGLCIGASAVLLMGLNGRIAGISGIAAGILRAPLAPDTRWRIAFMLGLLAGPLVAMALTGKNLIGLPVASPALLLVAGLATGLGTALGGGCTSGHGVCGMARLSVRSLVATLIFMAVAIVTVFITRHLL